MLMIRSRSSLTMPTLDDREVVPATISPTNYRSQKWLPKLLKPLGFIVIFGVVVYLFLIISSPSPLEEHKRSRTTSYEQLTVVMNTFERPDWMKG